MRKLRRINNWFPPDTGFEGLDRPVKLADFKLVKSLGVGAYGKVVCVKSIASQKKWAMKIIDKKKIENLSMVDQLKNEVNIMKKLQHENIIVFETQFEDHKNVYLILELAEEDHLYYRLKQVKKYNENIGARFMFDILKAINYLHQQDPPIIHRDIKPENILFCHGKLKIADFGWSNMKDRVRTTFCGTPDYLAPEMILSRGHTEKLDIWTLGVLMYELLVGNAPFSPSKSNKNKKAIQKMLNENIVRKEPFYPSNLSKEAKDLISKMMRKQSSQRVSANEALMHPWLKKNGFVFKGTRPRGPHSKIFLNIRRSSKLGPKNISEDIAPLFPGDNSSTQSSIPKAPKSINIKDLAKINPHKALSELSKKYSEKKKLIVILSGEVEDKDTKIQEQERTIKDLQEKLVRRKDGTIYLQEEVNTLEQQKQRKNEMAIELEGLRIYPIKLEELQAEMDHLQQRLKESESQFIQAQNENNKLSLRTKQLLIYQEEDMKNSSLKFKEWDSEKNKLQKQNDEMKSLLSKNPQTRPFVIENSLKRVMEVLAQIQPSIKTQMDQSKTQTNQLIKLSDLKQQFNIQESEMKMRILELESQLEGLEILIETKVTNKYGRQVELLKKQHRKSQDKMKDIIQMYKDKLGDSEIDDLRSEKIAERAKTLEGIIKEHKNLEESLKTKISSKDSEIETYKEVVKNLHSMVEKYKMKAI